MDVIQAIITRRSFKKFTGAAVTDEQLRELLELAVLAPNHRLTEPWRFFVVPHRQIEAFTRAVVGAVHEDDHPKLLAKRDALKLQLPKLGAFIQVCRTPIADDPRADQEDYAAVCCAVQNIMIAATGMGFGSFWSTGDIFERPGVREFLGVPPEMERVASLWLGVPAEPGKTHRTPVTMFTHWVE